MKNFYMKHEEHKDNGGAAGGGTGDVPPKETPKDDKETKTPGDNLDEFGYEKTPKADEPRKEDKKSVETPTEIEGTLGYGKEAVEPPKKDDPAPPPKDEAKPDPELGYELVVKDLDPADAKTIQDFAKAHKLTREAAQALVDKQVTEVKALEESIKEQTKLAEKKRDETRAAWDKELRTDPKFGGDKFAHNVTRIEKMMSEFMPETKKVLTENKSMLPPYVMRDLARLAEQLFGGEKLVTGDAPAGNAEETKKEDFSINDYYGIKN